MSALSSATSTRPPRRGGRRRPARDAGPPAARPRPAAASAAPPRRTARPPAETPAAPAARSRPAGPAGRCAEPSGRVTVNVVPDVGRALDVDRAAVQADQLADHRQADAAALAGARAGVRSTRWKRSKRRGSSSGGMPVPVSATVSTARSAVPAAAATAIPPLEGELDGVGEQVEDDLLPHVPVDVHRLAQRRAVDRRVEAGPLARPSGRRWPARAVTRREVDRLEPRLDPAGLEPGEVEQGVDQLAQPQGVALDDLELFAQPRRRPARRASRAARRPAP